MNLYTSRSVEVLDHGDGPGRYTLFGSDGEVWTFDEDGTVYLKRKAYSPFSILHELIREYRLKIVPPAEAIKLLERAKIHRIKGVDNMHVDKVGRKEQGQEEVIRRLRAYARKRWPYGGDHYAQMNEAGEYVIGCYTDMPVFGNQEQLTISSYEDLDTILDRRE